VLLLDEPFGALDAQVRQELRGWLRRLHDEIHVTTVFVTHDQEEAFEVADRVVVVNQGRIEQVGTPVEVFDHPANDFVMRFLGDVNVVEKDNARLYIRPHELELDRNPGADRFPAQVVRITPLGAVLKIELDVELLGQPLSAELDRGRAAALGLDAGETVYLSLRRARRFDAEVRDAA
jgi:sulfate transport system ATP-binding protein